MAKPFRTADARGLVSGHHALMERLGAAESALESCRREVISASGMMVDREVLDVLRAVPVEELNRDKRGIRVKSLRDAGFCSIADLASASVYAIEAVNGISREGAVTIKGIVADMVKKTRQGMKIRLSLDSKTPESTALVTAVAKYRALRPVADRCRKLLAENQQQTGYAIAGLTAAEGGLSWLFASKQKRQRAAESFELLSKLMSGEYGQNARALIRRAEEITGLSPDTAWRDFAAGPVGFFNTIEDIVPGILGNDDSVYGLPEDLAQEVREAELLPEGLLCELRRYQEWGVRYILHQGRVLLGDEMGLGKTVQAIAVMVSLKNAGATHFLVVCPASVLTNWCREVRKMSTLPVTRVHGPDRDAALNEWLEKGGVAVTTYETTSSLDLPEDLKPELLVVDEAHYIKNPDARRTRSVKRICARARRLLFMTGTALENRVDEMIELVNILRPDIAVTLRSMASLSAAPRFREAVAPVYYRRRREDVLTELPELIENREWCSLSPEEEMAYDSAVLRGSFTDARRVSWNMPDLSLSSKAQRLLELVEEAESEGRKVIVFSFFLDTVRKVTGLLGERCMSPITGSVSPPRRQEIVDEFESAPAGAVLPAQIQSGGTGLNIQSASVVVICEPQFKPSIENQAISRAYRMGQTRNVLVYRLLCEGTVDERITALLEDKQAVFDAFADKSVAAGAEPEIDETTFGDIIRAEKARISLKRGLPPDRISGRA